MQYKKVPTIYDMHLVCILRPVYLRLHILCHIIADCRVANLITRFVCSFKNSFCTFPLQSLSLWNAIDRTLFVTRARKENL